MYAKTAQNRRQQQGLPVTDRAGRAIGRLLGRQYHKLITRPDQILRSPPGFGFDVWAMETYVLPRVDELVVEDRVNGRVYRSTTENFRANRLEINRGAGPQYVLPLAYWTAEEGKTQRKAAPKAAKVVAPPVPVANASGQGRLM